MSTKPRTIFLVFAVLVIATLLGSIVFSRPGQVEKPKKELPKVVSKISTIQIESTKAIDENTEFARMEVVVRNNSAKAVMAIDLVAGEGAVTKNGLTDPDKPIIVIEPYGTTTLQMSFGEMTPGSDLVVAAVTYQDGSEEGDEKSLKVMRKIRARDHERIRKMRRGYQPE